MQVAILINSHVIYLVLRFLFQNEFKEINGMPVRIVIDSCQILFAIVTSLKIIDSCQILFIFVTSGHFFKFVSKLSRQLLDFVYICDVRLNYWDSCKIFGFIVIFGYCITFFFLLLSFLTSNFLMIRCFYLPGL